MPRKATKKSKRTNPGIAAAAQAVGSRFRLAGLIGLTPAAIYRWKRIPADRVKQIAKLTRVPREKLRPDLY